MRAFLTTAVLLVALAAVPGHAGGPFLVEVLLPSGTNDVGASPCTPVIDPLFETSCPTIHPGARASTPLGSCSLNFVVSDGTDLYIGTAGHCVAEGHRVGTEGIAAFGTVALDGQRGDWAFIRIDDDARALVSPETGRWGSPTAVRAPLLAGELVLHYGHGASWGQEEATRGRVGQVLVAGPDAGTFLFLGSVDYGDSGAPVMLGSGEAAGIVVATTMPGRLPSAASASRFDLAMQELSDRLGRPVDLVTGSTLVPPDGVIG